MKASKSGSITVAACVGVALVGALVLLGWSFESRPLMSFGLPVAMNPATASCFLLLAVGLWLRRSPEGSSASRRIALVLAGAVVVIGVIRFGAYLEGTQAYVDQLLFSSRLGTNKMAPNTALAFALIGTSLLFLDRETRDGRRVSELLALGVGIVALFAVMGYAYGVTELYGVLAFIPMAINTALSFLAISIGMLASRPDRGVMKLLTSEGQGGNIARRLLPAMIFVPTVLGWLMIKGERASLYSPQLAITMLAVLSIVILGVLVWATARVIYAIDSERREAATALESSMRALEQSKAEIERLSELSALLQACATDAEAGKLLSHFAPKLFPSGSGAFYTLAPSRNLLEVLASWGQGTQPAIAPETCWAFRRGRVHSREQESLPCEHADGNAKHIICAPMVANGDTMGTLYVNDTKAPDDALVGAVAERVALALANLRLRETLKSQAIRDHLTGLYNRRFMEETLERELKRASRNKRPVTVLMCDLDHFKPFNDRHGHSAGDELLAKVGRLLTSSIRGTDVPCRYGGEEFLLILPEFPLDDAIRRAEAICESVRGLGRGVTISIGVAAFPLHGATHGDVVRAADAALYRAKSSGRDHVEIASDDTPRPSRAAEVAATFDE